MSWCADVTGQPQYLEFQGNAEHFELSEVQDIKANLTLTEFIYYCSMN